MATLLDVLASFGFGGVLMMLILRLTLFFSSSHQQSNFTLRTQEFCVQLGKIMEYDFYKIGYGDPSKSPMRVADSTKIQFYADIDDDGAVDSVTYYAKPMSGRDARHFELFRQVNAGRPISMNLGLRKFRFTYYDSTSTPTATLSKIRAIKIAFDIENDYESVTGGGSDQVYPTVHWEQFIVPKSFHY